MNGKGVARKIGGYIRRHYLALLALFVALGGTALALDRNTVKSKHIAPGQVKLSDVSDKLRFGCPKKTRYHEGACLEPKARGTHGWEDAVDDCRDEGRRLPTIAELSTFRREPGVVIGSGGSQEWTDNADANSNNAWTVNGEGSVTVSFATNDLPYRCVAGAKR
jgi:hypothetical protein